MKSLCVILQVFPVVHTCYISIWYSLYENFSLSITYLSYIFLNQLWPYDPDEAGICSVGYSPVTYLSDIFLYQLWPYDPDEACICPVGYNPVTYLSDIFLYQLGPYDPDKAGICSVGYGPGTQCLSCAWGTKQQHTLWRLYTQVYKAFRLKQDERNNIAFFLYPVHLLELFELSHSNKVWTENFCMAFTF